MTLRVELIDPAELRPAPYNPRAISDRALAALARLLDEHGFVDPVIARREDRLVIGGHQRLRANALRARPDAKVPVIFLEGVSDERAKALNIALNNAAAQGHYDEPKLGQVLRDLQDAGLDVPAVTAFEDGELRRLCDVTETPPAPDADLPADDEAVGEGPHVVVILEMPPDTYQRAKPALDGLVADETITCHVRFDGDA